MQSFQSGSICQRHNARGAASDWRTQAGSNPIMRCWTGNGLGFGLINLISVTLASHNRDSAKQFAELIMRLPEVMEAHALTGEMDYMLKVVTRDLKGLSSFVNDYLLPHDAVQNVKTSIVLDTIKEGGGLPL